MSTALQLTPEEAIHALRGMEEWKLLLYRPYIKQARFHMLGGAFRERALIAGNKVGKTLCASMETAMHLTGRYPKWWVGKRFNRPILAWACGQTFEATRDNAQEMLLGLKPYGTAAIPRADIIRCTPRGGVSEAVDTAYIRHVTGGTSVLKFKAYQQKPIDWAGPNVDFGWCDEEPGSAHYSQLMARMMKKRGHTMLTFTPEAGKTEVVRMFYPRPQHVERVTVRMRMPDAPHFANDPEFMEREMERYPRHEREMRINGVPMMGTGQVYPIDPADYLVDAFEIPPSWAWLGGIDFGGDHPTACLWGAFDMEIEKLYVVNEYRQGREYKNEFMTSDRHANAMRSYQPWMPWAWPHDGLRQDGSANTVTMADTYRNAPNYINMLWERATFDGTDNSVEPGIDLISSWFMRGKLKVFRQCTMLRDELMGYHRKDGRIVKEDDDLVDALRYLIMMRRFADKPQLRMENVRADLSYNPLNKSPSMGQMRTSRYNPLDRRVH